MIFKTFICTVILGQSSRAATTPFQDILLHSFSVQDDLGFNYANIAPDLQNTLDKLLFMAVDGNDWERAHELVASGANPNCVVILCLLRDHSAMGNNAQVINIARLGASVDGNDHIYPLEAASSWGRVNTVKLLIKLGANPDGRDLVSKPLQGAARSGMLESVQALVIAGADIEALDAYGRTAMDCATQMRRSDIAAFLTAVRSRVGEVDKAVSAYIGLGESPIVAQIINIITAIPGARDNDSEWNIAVLSVAYKLKELGRDLLTVVAAPLILRGDWLPLRVSLVQRGLEVFANMKLSLAQFEKAVAPFLLNADIQSLIDAEVLSIAAHDLTDSYDFGFQERQREEILRVEGEVGRFLIRAVGVERTVSLFYQFHLNRFAFVGCLRHQGFPDCWVSEIDEFGNGQAGIIAGLRSIPKKLTEDLTPL